MPMAKKKQSPSPKCLHPDPINVAQLVEQHIENARKAMKWKHTDFWDIDRDIRSWSQGGRIVAFERVTSDLFAMTPTEALTFILESDIAYKMAYGVLYDNFDEMKARSCV